MILPIRIYGDPVLRKKSNKVDKITENLRNLSKDMVETMVKFDGIGLAANQVGIDLRIIIVDPKPAGFDTPPFVIINPEIVDSTGEQEEEEGCLSIPGYFLKITRPEQMKVRGIDLDGKEFIIHGEGLLARVLGHEIDHLNGQLIINHANGKKI